MHYIIITIIIIIPFRGAQVSAAAHRRFEIPVKTFLYFAINLQSVRFSGFLRE